MARAYVSSGGCHGLYQRRTRLVAPVCARYAKRCPSIQRRALSPNSLPVTIWDASRLATAVPAPRTVQIV